MYTLVCSCSNYRHRLVLCKWLKRTFAVQAATPQVAYVLLTQALARSTGMVCPLDQGSLFVLLDHHTIYILKTFDILFELDQITGLHC